MRRIVRVILWIIKGVLLAVALGALLFWPWSYWHAVDLMVSRSAIRSDQVDYFNIAIGWEDGRIVVAQWNSKYGRESPPEDRNGTTIQSASWEWHLNSAEKLNWYHDSDRSSDPIYWNSRVAKYPYGSFQSYWLSVRCGLVALLTAAWPLTSLTSLTLLFRRRSRRRRLASVGCCAKCGYDLRAMPKPGGELLTQCPECGTTTSPAKAE